MGKNCKTKVKIQDSTSETNLHFGILLFSPWAILAMLLRLGALQKV
jgi:hypothetical protein